MPHVRKTLRDWLKTNLAGSPQAGSRVYVRRTLPLDKNLQPSLLIAVQNERSTDAAMGGSQVRLVEFRVSACVKGDGEDAEDALDTLCVFVEKKLAALGGGAQTYEYQSTEFNFDASGERTLSVATMTFVAVIYTDRADPETAT